MRHYTGPMRWVVLGLTALLSLECLVVISGILVPLRIFLHPAIHIAFFLGITLTLVFLLFPVTKGALSNRLPWYDIILVIAGLIPTGYHVLFSKTAMMHGDLFMATTPEIIMGFVVMAVAIEATRRAIGLPFASIVVAFVLHLILGRFVPGGILQVRPFSMEMVAHCMYLHAGSVGGVLGTPVHIMATVIIMFVILGAFFQNTGAGPFFVNSVLAFLGKRSGGAAKAAVLGSGLVGAISGSGAANVGITGSLTIPMMKVRGCSPEYAAGVEAVASNGGQIMPPVMGAVAFLIAENLNIPYIDVCVAAVIPAILYYVAVFLQIHLHAAKFGMKGLPQEDIPSFWKTFKEGGQYLIPIAVLLFCLIELHYSAERSCLWALISLLIVASLRKASRLGGKQIGQVLDGLSPTIATMGSACAGAGIIISALVVSGLGTRITSALVDISGGSLFLLLLMAAAASFVLGMGSTSIPCYLVVALVVAPALVKAGVLPIAAHLFAFWFGIISFITPPVCLTTYVAAAIAGAEPMKAGLASMRLGIATFLIPFVMCYNPGFVLQGPLIDAIVPIVTVMIATFFLAAGVVGYMLKDLSWLERIICLAAAIMLIVPEWRTDIIGAGIGAVLVLWQLLARRTTKRSYSP